MNRRGAAWLIGVALLAAVGTACAEQATESRSSGRATTQQTMTSSGTVNLAALPESVAARYRFAEANRAVMERIPCYCGCGGLGHESLYDCFLAGEVGYESHGAGCGICQAEAVDVERMLGEGRDVASIRAEIDARYGFAGPPTKTQ